MTPRIDTMKLLTRKNDPVNRNGVTIVEVLTSIVVAVIGVAGVLVLIPFAVRQASVGLDLEEVDRDGRKRHGSI